MQLVDILAQEKDKLIHRPDSQLGAALIDTFNDDE